MGRPVLLYGSLKPKYKNGIVERKITKEAGIGRSIGKRKAKTRENTASRKNSVEAATSGKVKELSPSPNLFNLN